MAKSRSTSALLLALYGAARDMPEAQFQEHALELIKPRLGFEAALWGTGTTDGTSIAATSAHLHRVDPQALAEWKAMNSRDPAVPNTTKVFGRTVQYHIPTLFSTVDDARARDYAQRWKRRYFLATAQPNESADGLQWMSLYRMRDQPYTDQERGLCEAWMPHLAEALRINRSLAVARAADLLGPDDGRRALALVDAHGQLRYAQRRFMELLAIEWPGLDDRRVPKPLCDGILNTQDDLFVGNWIRVRIRHSADLHLMEASPKTMLDALSPQRARVARLFAQGYSYKAIARELHLQPATVRNHLATAYRELRITDRQQLQRLDQLLLMQPDRRRAANESGIQRDDPGAR